MAKVYRESRSEIIEPAIGSKLIWMLQAVGKVIEVSDLESRITALESKSWALKLELKNLKKQKPY